MKVNNMNFKKNDKLSYTFLRLVTEISEIDKRTRNYGTDEKLHNAEIHMIKTIYENKDIHVSALADKLGVTKGAISQVIFKLEKKNMVVKEKDPKNLSRILLNVSEKGEIAYFMHEKLHKDFNDIFLKTLSIFSKEEVNVIKRFLNNLENDIKGFEDLDR